MTVHKGVQIDEVLQSIDRGVIMKDRQTRYQKLVDEYGMEYVAQASELSKDTLRVYLQSSTPSIGLDSLMQAEQVFKRIG